MKIVSFDCWETVIHDTAELERPRSAARIQGVVDTLAQLGLRYSSARMEAAYVRAGERYDEICRTDVEVDTREQLAMMLDILDRGLSDRLDEDAYRALEHSYIQPIFESPPFASPTALEAMTRLKAAGYRLGMVCNTGRTPGDAIRRLLDQYGILALLDEAVFSNEEGIRKPKAEIFHRLVQRLGGAPADAIHVGDNPIADAAGATRAGLIGVLLSSAPHPAADYRIESLRELPELVERLAGSWPSRR